MNNLKNNQVVENQVNNPIENKKNMNNIIDFASVCGEGKVAQTATVDQQIVNDLFKAFLAVPSSVVIKFKNEHGYLRIIVKMTYREKFYRTYETYGDAKLVEAIIKAMKGYNFNPLQFYRVEEHELKASDVDCRIDIFRQFINSTMRCSFDNDFIAGNGERYVCASFNICFGKEVKFCLKRTEEIEAIINEAIHAA